MYDAPSIVKISGFQMTCVDNQLANPHCNMAALQIKVTDRVLYSADVF